MKNEMVFTNQNGHNSQKKGYFCLICLLVCLFVCLFVCFTILTWLSTVTGCAEFVIFLHASDDTELRFNNKIILIYLCKMTVFLCLVLQYMSAQIGLPHPRQDHLDLSVPKSDFKSLVLIKWT